MVYTTGNFESWPNNTGVIGGGAPDPRFFFYQSVVSTANDGNITNPFSTNFRSFENRDIVDYAYTNLLPSTVFDFTQNRLVSGDRDLLLQNDITIRRNLVVGSPFSRFRANGANRTITFTGTGELRNSGTMFGEFGGNLLTLTFDNLSNISLTGSNNIDARTFNINSGAVVDAGTQGINSNSAGGVVNITGTLRTADPDGLYNGTIGTIRNTNITSGNVVINSGSTIDYYASGAQSITALTYSNLNTSISGTKTLAGDVTVNSVLTIGTGSTLDASNRTINLAGSGTPFVNSGTFTASTSTVNYSSASATNITAATYNNLNTSGASTKTLAGDVTVNSVLTIGTGSTLDASSRTINLAGSGAPFVNSGTFTASTSTVNYNNVSSTTIANLNYNNLNGTGGDRTISGTVGISGAFTPGAGSYTLTGSTINFNNSTGGQTVPAFNYNNLTVSNTSSSNSLGGNVVVSSTLTLNTSSKLSIGSNTLTLNGTATGSGTLIGSASSNLTIGGSVALGTISFETGSQTLGTLSVDRTSSGSATLGTPLTVTTALTVTSGTTLNNGGNTLTVSAAGDNSVAGVIAGTGQLIKSGTGTLTLSGANTYTGATTVSGGTLALGIANALSGTTAVTLNGGTLSTTGTFNQSVGTLNLNTTSTISLFNGSHNLNFAASDAITWNGTTLTITGWQGAAGLPGTSGKLFVGSNATGLTPEQLAKITFTGYCTGAAQLPNGEVVPRAVLPTAFLSTTSNIVAGTNRIFDPANNCSALTAILPSGLDEVAGNVTTQVWVEATQPSNAQGRPFAKRHYEITPATNAANATSTITLYFLQSEFDDFNAFNPSGPDMPTGPGDGLGISNLRIYKYAGSSSPNDGLPASYAGAGSLIDPADGNIVWSVANSRWEITFDVVGFSGFFVTNQNFTILPLQLISFTGSKQATGNALGWQTANEQNTKRFELERSANGNSFARIATITAAGAGSHRYSHTDAATQHGTVWYRLKMIDTDGKFSYSPVVIIQPTANDAITLFPNPAKNLVNLSIGNRNLLNTTAQVMDAKGALVQTTKLTGYNQQFNVAPLAKGMYLLKFADGTVLRFVKE
jgi:autotransporter-associated beta strand protein